MTTIDTRADVDLDVRPLTATIGAEIHGVDLAADLSDDVVAAIRAALLRWRVVFFRDQAISPADQVAFGRRFGDVTPAHPTLPSLEGHPEVLALDSRAYARALESAGVDPAQLDEDQVDNRWHTDVTFVPNPPLGSILHGVVVPPYGGDTHWADLVGAYQSLSPALRDTIDGLRAVHTNTLYGARRGPMAELRQRFESTPYEAEHPVVRVHPETGEKALFVNPGFTRRIVGVRQRESDALLRILFGRLESVAHQVRFRWRPGSVAFWDNRATVHRAPGDLRGLGFERVMHRITLAGDLPVGPDGATSTALQGATFS